MLDEFWHGFVSHAVGAASGMSEPQDIAEALDDERVGVDPITHDQVGAIEMPGDLPYAVNETIVTEPIVDSVASREARLEPETWSTTPTSTTVDLDETMTVEEVHLIADDNQHSAEEEAVHLSE